MPKATQGKTARRVLGAARLSHDTDTSTSIERQTEDLTRRVHADRDTLVDIAVDTDISGAVSVFERPGLGPWLTDPTKISQWDTLMVSKLDRLSRSVRDFGDLLEWCKANGKNVVSLDGEVNTDTATGWLHVQIIMTFAEFERRRMSERRSDASVKIASRGGWHGGHSTEWGYRPVKVDGIWQQELDPEQVPLINEAANRVIKGESTQSVALDLGLDPANLARRLRRPSLYGAIVFKGELVRGADGMPLMREPVIDRKTWNKLQARLEANSRGAGVPRDASAWLHVIHCYECGEPMYRQPYSDGRSHIYYHKRSLAKYRDGKVPVCRINLNGRDLERQISPMVQRAWAGRFAIETITIPGEDNTEELARVDEAISDLNTDRYERGLFRGEDGSRRYAEIMSRLEARRQEILDAGVIVPDKSEIVVTDVLLTDMWAECEDEHAQGALLRRMGYRIYARKAGYGKASIKLVQVPRDGKPVWRLSDIDTSEMDPYESPEDVPEGAGVFVEDAKQSR
jgi:site-specific DNA recombinase